MVVIIHLLITIAKVILLLFLQLATAAKVIHAICNYFIRSLAELEETQNTKKVSHTLEDQLEKLKESEKKGDEEKKKDFIC